MKNLARWFSRFGAVAILFTLIFVVDSPQGIGKGSDELERRFLDEAPNRWEEYVRLSGALQGVVYVSQKGTIDDSTYNCWMEYKTNGKAKVLKVVTKEIRNGKVEQDDEQIFGLNSRYAFALTRRSSDLPWILTDFFELSTSSTARL